LFFQGEGKKFHFLEENGISVEIVPGITSGIAASSYAGIPLTHRHGASSVTFVTGHESSEKQEKSVNWRQLALSSNSLVIYMGIRNIEYIVEELIIGGMKRDTKCAVIQEATLKNQKSLIIELSKLPEAIKKNNIKPPAIVIIGRIVDFQVKNTITKLSTVNLPKIKKI